MSFGGFGGFGGLGGMPTRFEEQYHCYSVAYADKSHLEVSKVTFISFQFPLLNLYRFSQWHSASEGRRQNSTTTVRIWHTRPSASGLSHALPSRIIRQRNIHPLRSSRIHSGGGIVLHPLLDDAKSVDWGRISHFRHQCKPSKSHLCQIAAATCRFSGDYESEGCARTCLEEFQLCHQGWCHMRTV